MIRNYLSEGISEAICYILITAAEKAAMCSLFPLFFQAGFNEQVKERVRSTSEWSSWSFLGFLPIATENVVRF